MPKPWRVPKKQSFGAKTLESTKKLQKKTKFWSPELPNYPMLQNFVFFVPSSVLAPKLWFFGTLHGFGKVLLQNAFKKLRGPKNPNQAMGSENLRICDSTDLRIVDSGNFNVSRRGT